MVTRITATAAAQHHFLRARDELRELAAQVDLSGVWETEVRSLIREDVNRSLENLRVVVTKDTGPEPAVQINVLVAIDVPEPCARRPREVQRVRVIPSPVPMHTARRKVPSDFVELRGLARVGHRSLRDGHGCLLYTDLPTEVLASPARSLGRLTLARRRRTRLSPVGDPLSPAVTRNE